MKKIRDMRDEINALDSAADSLKDKVQEKPDALILILTIIEVMLIALLILIAVSSIFDRVEHTVTHREDPAYQGNAAVGGGINIDSNLEFAEDVGDSTADTVEGSQYQPTKNSYEDTKGRPASPGSDNGPMNEPPIN